jgi:hypothetical protein
LLCSKCGVAYQFNLTNGFKQNDSLKDFTFPGNFLAKNPSANTDLTVPPEAGYDSNALNSSVMSFHVLCQPQM